MSAEHWQPQLPGTELAGADLPVWWHWTHPYAEFAEYRRIMGIPDTGPVLDLPEADP